MKFSLIALHAHLVLQFQESAPYTAVNYKGEDGSTVNITSGAPSVQFGVTKDKDKEGKEKFNVNITAPTGPNTFNPVVIPTGDNDTRDKLAAVIVAGLRHKEVVQEAPEVIIPKEG